MLFFLYWFIGSVLVIHILDVATVIGIDGETILYMITEDDDFETRDFFRNNRFAYRVSVIISMVVISLIWPYVLYIIYHDDDYKIFRF